MLSRIGRPINIVFITLHKSSNTAAFFPPRQNSRAAAAANIYGSSIARLSIAMACMSCAPLMSGWLAMTELRIVHGRKTFITRKLSPLEKFLSRMFFFTQT